LLYLNRSLLSGKDIDGETYRFEPHLILKRFGASVFLVFWKNIESKNVERKNIERKATVFFVFPFDIFTFDVFPVNRIFCQ
jgi:hypothetical protein